jgi:hypothetical protein
MIVLLDPASGSNPVYNYGLAACLRFFGNVIAHIRAWFSQKKKDCQFGHTYKMAFSPMSLICVYRRVFSATAYGDNFLAVLDHSSRENKPYAGGFAPFRPQRSILGLNIGARSGIGQANKFASNRRLR